MGRLMRFKPSIKTSLLLLGVVPALLIGLVIEAYFVHVLFNQLDAGLRQRGDLIVRQLAAAASDGLVSGNRKSLQNLANMALLEKDVNEVNIFDKSRLMASAKLVSGSENSTNCLVFVFPVFNRHDPAASLLMTSQAAAVHSSNQKAIIGNVRVSLSRTDTLKNQHEIFILSLLLAFGGILVSALLAYRMGQKISLPVLSLTNAVHALSLDRLETRAQSLAAGELAYLQAGFAAMAAELQKNREHLEQQIRKATQQVARTLASLEERNAELDIARKDAESQTALKSLFLAQLSHEIRTPLNGILGFSELLAQTPLSGEQAEKLGLIEQSAKQMLAIINDILDISKLEAGKISLNIYPFMLRPYLEDTIALLAPRAARMPIILWISPEAPQSFLGDPIRLQQVINNLLSNALKFTHQGRIIIRVRSHWEGTSQQLLFSVSDSGSGISPNDLKNLFVPFQQVSEFAVHHERGMGLGLTIANNIIERMGGLLKVASRPGRGTTFWFRLPITADSLVGSLKLSNRFIAALVDSDPLFRQALRYQLEALGAQVHCFPSFGVFAENYHATKHGKLVLINAFSHPRDTGACLSQWLEQSEAKCAQPVLIMSSGDRRSHEYYRQKGALCLTHPVRNEQLRPLLIKSTEPPPHPEALPAPIIKPISRTPDLRGRQILIADDHAINRKLLHAQLSRWGANIVEACDGQEALQLILNQSFELIFLDLQMPVMNGLAVMQEFRKAFAGDYPAPVIAITAHVQPEQKEVIMHSGFAECLIKPVTTSQLSQLITKLFGQTIKAASEPEKIPPPPISAKPYLRALLEKTDGNRELALVITRELFAELPGQLHQLAAALSHQERMTAKFLAHKLHGSAAFCGLDDIRSVTSSLEAALDQNEAYAHLEVLQRALTEKIDRLLAEKATILEELADNGLLVASTDRKSQALNYGDSNSHFG